MMIDQYIDLTAFAWLIETERHNFGDVDLDAAFAENSWKQDDMKWFAANKDSKFRVRQVMQGEFSSRIKASMRALKATMHGQNNKWANNEPTHVLIEKVATEVRAKAFLVNDDATLFCHRSDEDIIALLMDRDENIPMFIDVDLVEFPNGALVMQELVQ